MSILPFSSSELGAVAGTLADAGANLANGSFQAPNQPTQSGAGSRQSSLASNRPAIETRNLIRWLVPETGIVQMYINPNSISYKSNKNISSQRTKGGYVLQYWGEELTKISIAGTTGTSGIEGINVLEDIYRNEQLAFDPYALAFEAETYKNSSLENSSVKAIQWTGAIADLVSDATNSSISVANRAMPSLAQFAFTVEMYYSGWVYRGYFTNFNVMEKADRLGLFDYDMEFVVTQRRGWRENYLGWHRSATDGPSNSDKYGPPHSFNGIAKNNVQGNSVPAATIISGINAANTKLMGI
jgi:hypothetical protein